MKNTTKIATTLVVGLGLLAGSVGVASASPHYTDWPTRVVGEPVQAVRVTHIDVQKHAASQTKRLKDFLVTSPRRNLETNVWTNGSASSVQTNDSVTHLEHGPGLHGHGVLGSSDRPSSFFSRGLHNNGSFLPIHRSYFIAIR